MDVLRVLALLLLVLVGTPNQASWASGGSPSLLNQTSERRISRCAQATIDVETSVGVVRVDTGEVATDYFGREVHADELLAVISLAADSSEGSYQDERDCTEEERRIAWAASLLAAVHDTRAVDPLIRLTDDRRVCVYMGAIHALGKLRDRKAVPILCELLSTRDSRSSGAVRALALIGDDSAVSALIDSIPAGGSGDAEQRFKAIEQITGLSLDGIRKQWGHVYPRRLEEFHQALHQWWDTNRTASTSASQ